MIFGFLRGGRLKWLSELVNGFNLINQGSNRVAAQTTRLSDSAQKMKSLVDGAASNLTRIDETERNLRDCVREIDSAMSSLGEKARYTQSQKGRMTESVRNLADATGELKVVVERTAQISAFADEISALASELRLLSFNASIESAKAGKQGRAFSVVAEKVQSLALQSGEMATNIRKIVDASGLLLKGIGSTIEKTASDARESVAASVDAISAIETQVVDSSRRVEVLNQKFQEQSEASKALSGILTSIISDLDINVAGISDLKKDTDSVKTACEKLDSQVNDIVCTMTGTKIVEKRPDEIRSVISKYKIVDVRAESEFNDDLSHIPSAHLLTLTNSFGEDLKKRGFSKSEKLLLVCRSGGRSARACRLALSDGFRDVTNLKGGMLEWKKQNSSMAA